MPIEIIYKNRRKGGDRRKTITIGHEPERRSGLDRRKLDEKLKQLIQSSLKDSQKKPQETPPLSSSKPVILRKKSEEEPKDSAGPPDTPDKI